MALKMSGTEARANLADVLNKVTERDEVLEVTKYSKTVAYVISAERYERMSRAVMQKD